MLQEAALMAALRQVAEAPLCFVLFEQLSADSLQLARCACSSLWPACSE